MNQDDSFFRPKMFGVRAEIHGSGRCSAPFMVDPALELVGGQYSDKALPSVCRADPAIEDKSLGDSRQYHAIEHRGQH
jgi:hypothetical protein